MKKLRAILITIFLGIAFFVILKDLGDYNNKPGGAGEIWWTQVPQIDELYRKHNP